MEGPGCCMEPTIPLGLASGILSLFLYPHHDSFDLWYGIFKI